MSILLCFSKTPQRKWEASILTCAFLYQLKRIEGRARGGSNESQPFRNQVASSCIWLLKRILQKLLPNFIFIGLKNYIKTEVTKHLVGE